MDDQNANIRTKGLTRERANEQREAALDRALEDSFPASDPVAMEQPAIPQSGAPWESPAPVIATKRARQGVTGHNVRYVLALGLAGVIVAFAVVYLAYYG